MWEYVHKMQKTEKKLGSCTCPLFTLVLPVAFEINLQDLEKWTIN